MAALLGCLVLPTCPVDYVSDMCRFLTLLTVPLPARTVYRRQHPLPRNQALEERQEALLHAGLVLRPAGQAGGLWALGGAGACRESGRMHGTNGQPTGLAACMSACCWLRGLTLALLLHNRLGAAQHLSCLPACRCGTARWICRCSRSQWT